MFTTSMQTRRSLVGVKGFKGFRRFGELRGLRAYRLYGQAFKNGWDVPPDTNSP